MLGLLLRVFRFALHLQELPVCLESICVRAWEDLVTTTTCESQGSGRESSAVRSRLNLNYFQPLLCVSCVYARV